MRTTKYKIKPYQPGDPAENIIEFDLGLHQIEIIKTYSLGGKGLDDGFDVWIDGQPDDELRSQDLEKALRNIWAKYGDGTLKV